MKIVSYGPARAEQPGILIDDETRIIPVSLLATRLGLPPFGQQYFAGIPALPSTAHRSRVGAMAVRASMRKTVRLGPRCRGPRKSS